MYRLASALMLPPVLWASTAYADYRITQDYGGSIERYKAKYALIRDRGERVIIDGICDSACTLVLGIVPLDRVCATPRATLGFHMPHYDLAATDGIKIVSYRGTADFMAHYPEAVKQWLGRRGGLTAETKELTGPELSAIVHPCP
jgi:hypothetical protein